MAPSTPNRRDLLAGLAAALPLSACAAVRNVEQRLRPELEADIVVLGGGLGGCAAALAACRGGRRVILVEPDLWIGGQLTNQAVPPDENGAIETGGAPASYRQLRERIRAEYRRRGLTEAAAKNARLNPGGGFVSRLCCDPRSALTALDAMLAPAIDGGLLTILTEHEWVAGDVEGDQVRAVTVRDASGTTTTLLGQVFLDASEEGDVLELLGVEHVVGAEARATHGEPSALERANPRDQQAITWCFAMEHRPGEDHVGDPPSGWDRWSRFEPDLTPPWTGPQYSLVASHPITLEPRQYAFEPPARRSRP